MTLKTEHLNFLLFVFLVSTRESWLWFHLRGFTANVIYSGLDEDLC